MKAKSFLTVHKLTQNPLDIEAALEALETAYACLENTCVTSFELDYDEKVVRKVDDNFRDS